MHQGVRAGHQVPQDALTGGGCQVEGDALLVGVEVQKKPAAFPVGVVVQEGAVLPGWVAGGGRLNLHDFGPHVGQQLAAIRGGDQPAQLQYLKPCKQGVRHSLSLLAGVDTGPVA
jgi:hypothetical protein